MLSLIHIVTTQIILLFYPETKGVSLEDMDILFKNQHFTSTHDARADEPLTITTIEPGLPKSPELPAR